ALALMAWRAPQTDKLRAVQFLAVLPTGALLMATGGDDLPVLALLLLALVLARQRRPVGSGLAVAVAAATKQTAWILVPFLVATVLARLGRRSAAALAGAAAAVAIPIIAVFVAWNPG